MTVAVVGAFTEDGLAARIADHLAGREAPVSRVDPDASTGLETADVVVHVVDDDSYALPAVATHIRFLAQDAVIVLDARSAFTVPDRDLPWPASDRPRTVAISAMGFGGTNGHLLLTDTAPGLPSQAPPADDPLVVTAWAVELPGSPDRGQVVEWLRGAPADWPTRFAVDDIRPTPLDASLAPSAIAAMDLSQLIAIRCADALVGPWTSDRELADRTGVFVGHTGPTRAAVDHDLRCYLRDLAARVGQHVERFEERVVRPAMAAVPPATEDTYPGLMPNTIPVRLAQRYDLHGPNMALDAGLDSFTSALVTAVHSLRDGETDLAIVIGVAAAADHVRPRDGREPAEAAAGVVVTRRSVAAAHGLPELAVLELTAPVGTSTHASACSSPAVASSGGRDRQVRRRRRKGCPEQPALGPRAGTGARRDDRPPRHGDHRRTFHRAAPTRRGRAGRLPAGRVDAAARSIRRPAQRPPAPRRRICPVPAAVRRTPLRRLPVADSGEPPPCRADIPRPEQGRTTPAEPRQSTVTSPLPSRGGIVRPRGDRPASRVGPA
ncbi:MULTISPECIES: beta-ketoacyl synthase N-terminal-like domain-containing protein [Saccharothrix]|uniref:beta-ketoacyl synthase N-terminal-like domain-containing protein n=1 Tax=Saccharothrix TaxID=2071 RepID=UPI000938BF5A|nr:beta-ketoacyl synthase N-terminal-like domain-containing protein [Saccharothrix sp. CB00851]OKI13774.1 hypothetical protein A6A25_15920 [Saccharothrix sp. CB00851]